jgi:hypothetical protein
MALRCLKSETIDIADPARILTHDIVSGSFAGLPTLIIKPAALIREPATVVKAACGMLAGTFRRAAQPAAEDVLAKSVAAHVGILHRRTQTSQDAHIPAVVLGDLLTTVMAPGAEYSAEMLLCGSARFSRENCPPLAADNKPMRYHTVCHELAHGTGADEPQEDRIAALLARRAFGNGATVMQMADIRALETMHAAMAVHRGEDTPQERDYLDEYGWRMVDANDAVAALSDTEIAAMDERQIMERPAFANDSAATMALAAAMDRAGVITRGCLRAVANSAAMLENRAGTAGDPSLQRMAARYVLAARRLADGAYGPAP